MAPPSPLTDITLKIKVPPGYVEGGADEFALGSVAVSSTIGAIRQHIQQTVPSHPAPEKQRLLYGGRALVDNEQMLADALNTKRDPTQTEYVVHLLVKGEGHGSVPASASAGGGHRRVVSTPTPGAQGQLPHPSQAQQPLSHEQQVRQQQEHLHRLLQQQQQQQQQIMQQRAQMGMAMGMQGGMMPPQFAGMPGMPGMQMPHGMPFQQPPMGQGFGQAVVQGQQQRAARGLHGMGPQGQQTAFESNAQSTTAPEQAQGQQHTHQPAQQTAQNTPSQPPLTNGQPTHPHGHPRPVSGQGFHFEGIGPNGQRVQISQHTLQIPTQHTGIPGQPFGMPGMLPPQLPQMPQIPGFMPAQPSLFAQPPQQQQQQPAGPSALERARENMAEMRRMLDEMRDSTVTTEDQRQQIERLQERVRGVGEYINPFPNLFGNNGGGGAGGSLFGNDAGHRSASPGQGGGQGPPAAAGRSSIFGNPPGTSFFGGPSARSLFAPPMPPQNSSDTTCYLLSGPQGPQALLFSPQHGTYTGAFTNAGAAAGLRPTPTSTTGAAAGQQGFDQIVQAAQAAGLVRPHPTAGAGAAQVAGMPDAPPAPNAPGAQPAPNAHAQPNPAAAQDPLGPLQGVLNHLWLLLRVLVFAYFVLGSNLGWRRPVALLVITLGLWMVRAGLFGDGGVMRRWWDGIVHVGPPPAQQGREDAGQGAAAGGDGGQGGAPGGVEAAARQGMPTPEQVAQRLIDERNGRQDARTRQLRELVRPLERAVALFVASLWPGVGEAHVRARQQEERRRDEEEIAVRRREEEARVRAEEERKSEAEGKREETVEKINDGKIENERDGPPVGGEVDGRAGVASGAGDRESRVEAGQ